MDTFEKKADAYIIENLRKNAREKRKEAKQLVREAQKADEAALKLEQKAKEKNAQ